MEYIDREKNPQIICTTLAQARELVRLGNDPKPTLCWSVGAMASLLPAGTLLATKKDESLRDIVFNALVNNLSK